MIPNCLHHSIAHDLTWLVIPCGLYIFLHLGHWYSFLLVRARISIILPVTPLVFVILRSWGRRLNCYTTVVTSADFDPVCVYLLIFFLQFWIPNQSRSFWILSCHFLRTPAPRGRLKWGKYENIAFLTIYGFPFPSIYQPSDLRAQTSEDDLSLKSHQDVVVPLIVVAFHLAFCH